MYLRIKDLQGTHDVLNVTREKGICLLNNLQAFCRNLTGGRYVTKANIQEIAGKVPGEKDKHFNVLVDFLAKPKNALILRDNSKWPGIIRRFEKYSEHLADNLPQKLDTDIDGWWEKCISRSLTEPSSRGDDPFIAAVNGAVNAEKWKDFLPKRR